jgi:hypothetical protein
MDELSHELRRLVDAHFEFQYVSQDAVRWAGYAFYRGCWAYVSFEPSRYKATEELESTCGNVDSLLNMNELNCAFSKAHSLMMARQSLVRLRGEASVVLAIFRLFHGVTMSDDDAAPPVLDWNQFDPPAGTFLHLLRAEAPLNVRRQALCYISDSRRQLLPAEIQDNLRRVLEQDLPPGELPWSFIRQKIENKFFQRSQHSSSAIVERSVDLVQQPQEGLQEHTLDSENARVVLDAAEDQGSFAVSFKDMASQVQLGCQELAGKIEIFGRDASAGIVRVRDRRVSSQIQGACQETCNFDTRDSTLVQCRQQLPGHCTILRFEAESTAQKVLTSQSRNLAMVDLFRESDMQERQLVPQQTQGCKRRSIYQGRERLQSTLHSQTDTQAPTIKSFHGRLIVATQAKRNVAGFTERALPPKAVGDTFSDGTVMNGKAVWEQETGFNAECIEPMPRRFSADWQVERSHQPEINLVRCFSV